MGRKIRYIPPGGSLVEVTTRTIQGRYLLRPDKLGRLNEIILGVAGRAQRLTSMSVCGISVLSNHVHLLVYAEDAGQLSQFMCHFNTNLSKEVGRLVDWQGPLWSRRYQEIQISTEEKAQTARLRYLLAAGVKEFLVDRADEWPGVHSVRALRDGEELRGLWFDRSQEFAARHRGESFSRTRFATEEVLTLDPLPCWRHLSVAMVRSHVAELVEAIEREASQERQKLLRTSMGVGAIVRVHPHQRSANLERSPAPDFHAASRQAKAAMQEAYGWVVAKYQAAAERWRSGDRLAEFPEGTFPPGLPFVAFALARGHPP